VTRPIPDKAEVVLEYPEKFYAGTFERSARFDAHFDGAGVSLLLDHPGDVDARKSVHLHFHYALFADILGDLAKTTAAISTDPIDHRKSLGEAAKALHEALAPIATGSNRVCTRGDKAENRVGDDLSRMSPEEEVLLLHVME
jgi:hypothetical protein